jgi:flagellar protein FlbD
MIKLTRLDRQEIALNCDRIEWVEACPDTTVRLVGGESILVHQTVDEVIALVAAFRGRVLREAGLVQEAEAALTPHAALPRPRRDPKEEETVVVFDRDSITVVEDSP